VRIQFYIDKWFVFIFCIYYVLLDITDVLGRFGCRIRRKLTAAFWGSGIALLGVLALIQMRNAGVGAKFSLFALSQFLALVGMLLLVSPRPHLLRSFICYILAAILLAGILTAWYMHGAMEHLPVMLLVLALFMGGIRVTVRFWRARAGGQGQFRMVQIANVDELVRAYYDSGNCLLDPYGQRPVAIASQEVLSRAAGHLGKALLIPYYALGNDEGMIVAYPCDEITVWEEKDGKPVAKPRVYTSVLLAEDTRIFAHQQDYEMILHSSMV
jgi:hypothetical protein